MSYALQPTAALPPQEGGAHVRSEWRRGPFSATVTFFSTICHREPPRTPPRGDNSSFTSFGPLEASLFFQ